jgi:hypothetical protein
MILRTYVNFYVSATRRAHLSSSEGFLDISLPGSRSTNGDAMGSRAFQWVASWDFGMIHENDDPRVRILLCLIMFCEAT